MYSSLSHNALQLLYAVRIRCNHVTRRGKAHLRQETAQCQVRAVLQTPPTEAGAWPRQGEVPGEGGAQPRPGEALGEAEGPRTPREEDLEAEEAAQPSSPLVVPAVALVPRGAAEAREPADLRPGVRDRPAAAAVLAREDWQRAGPALWRVAHNNLSTSLSKIVHLHRGKSLDYSILPGCNRSAPQKYF